MIELPPPVRCVLVTGSRKWSDVWAIKAELDAAVADAFADGVTELIIRHGACYPPVDRETGRRPFESADYLAHLWVARFAAEQPLTITEQERPADWEAPCRSTCRVKQGSRARDHRRMRGGRSICPAAGNYRNIAMIGEQPAPYRGYAFILDGSTGATHCKTKMREFSIPVDPIERSSR